MAIVGLALREKKSLAMAHFWASLLSNARSSPCGFIFDGIYRMNRIFFFSSNFVNFVNSVSKIRPQVQKEEEEAIGNLDRPAMHIISWGISQPGVEEYH